MELDENYFESFEFANQYFYSLREEVRSLVYNTNEPNLTNNLGARLYYRPNTVNGFMFLENYKYLIIHNTGNKIYTNVENFYDNPNIEQVKDIIKSSSGIKFYIENGVIKTDSVILQEHWQYYEPLFQGTYYYSKNNEVKDTTNDYEKALEKYMNGKESVEYSEEVKEYDEDRIKIILQEAEENIVYVDYDIGDFTIYMAFDEKLSHSNYDMYILSIMELLKDYEDILYVSVPICGIFTVIIAVYLVMAIGYKKSKEDIELNDIDKIPIEIIICILSIVLGIISEITTRFTNTRFEYFKLYLSEIVTAYAVIYILSAVTLTTIVKRIKLKVLIKNSLIWKFFELLRSLFDKIRKIFEVLIERLSTNWKVILSVCGYLFITGMIKVLLNSAITIYVIYYIIKRLNCFEKIKEQLKKIYEGDNKDRLEENDFTKEFKEVTHYVNDISNGFENAVEEGIKSERLKTELITNVSHDIKTPLTSIINYADLIKQENIENEKVNEYIDILLSKSHRLKRLTEDLVEASKVSSGNVKLNLENINIVELINQTTGEFEDKFNEKNLTIITDMPKEDILVEADSRYMYRLIENVFSNIAKYALEHSRVYIDMEKEEEKVKIEIKNISKDKLNISEEELMQRFVRGDKSRTTEGSGLGLSISRSLTELQKGIFKIEIDGDLFKVKIEFNIKK